MNKEEVFSELEKEAHNHLIAAWNAFAQLGMTHPSHKKDFTDGIHRCQYVIGQRLLQRSFPDIYATYEKDDF